MKHLYKLAFILVIGTGLALAQTTPSTSPSGGAQTPDQSQMGQKGAGSANAVSDIQTALHKQLPNVADNVTVSTTDDNKVQLSGTVSSDAEKQQVEQIARTAAPNADITNKLTVSSSTPGNEPGSQPPSSQPPASSKPPKVQLIAYQTGSASQTPSSQTSPSSQTPSSQAPSTAPSGSMSQTSQAGSSDVQDKIQKAIQQDSSLSGANVNVSVTGDKVELTGTVANKDQKKTVKQIAESNAGGMKVVDHVKVEGKGSSTSPETPKN